MMFDANNDTRQASVVEARIGLEQPDNFTSDEQNTEIAVADEAVKSNYNSAVEELDS